MKTQKLKDVTLEYRKTPDGKSTFIDRKRHGAETPLPFGGIITLSVREFLAKCKPQK